MKLRKVLLSVTAIIIALIVFKSYQNVNASYQPMFQTPGESIDAFIPSNNDVTLAKSTDRGRPQISDDTIVADNGFPLRGEHIRLAEFIDPDVDPNRTWREIAYDTDMWLSLINDYHLNTARLLLYRPPQNWSGGSCDNPPGRCYDSVNDAVAYIDDMVEIASQLGMYLIIDYHPVGGHDEADAQAWWDVLAPRYKDRTHVIYELCNEPVMWSASSYDDAAIQFEEDLYQLIRGKAPNTHIIMWSFAESSGDGDNMLTKVELGQGIDYSNVSVGYHPYQQNNFNQNEIDTLRNHGYAVIDTEIGDAAGYTTRTASEEAQGVSWIWLDGIYDSIPVTWAMDPKTVPSLTEVPVQSVTINGGNACPIGLACSFSATVDPNTATVPITYTWQASEQSGAVHQTTATIDYFYATWSVASTQYVTVTAQNAFGDATASHTFEVKSFDYAVYLPLVLKNY